MPSSHLSKAHSRTHTLTYKKSINRNDEAVDTDLEETLPSILFVKGLMPYGFEYVVEHEVSRGDQRTLGIRRVVSQVGCLSGIRTLGDDRGANIHPSVMSDDQPG